MTDVRLQRGRGPGQTLIEHVLQAALVSVIAFLGIWLALVWAFRRH